ncbi:hypothetical protein [Mariniflexile rhizosphaerae]|uniref:hypothetical protein n=1 Tax=unclassified Mariniflexile TaxID=2643887 RepID=UPI000CC2CEEA|nr:hypothetical protein [Mariniflexile sp. TRM1-10]PLB18860.1 MAG: hypothetical protein TRG1_2374 [Flavobacteriaceae bacterium FS1-H7996/R]
MHGKLENTIKYNTIESIDPQGLRNYIEGMKEDIRNSSANINSVYFSNTSNSYQPHLAHIQ